MPANKKVTISGRNTGSRIVSVGTSNPPRKYTQKEVVELYGETNPKIVQFFMNGYNISRCLYLPEPVNGKMPEESNQDLINKHLGGALEIGPLAIEDCLKPIGLSSYDIDFFCVTSSTGFLCPGLSAHLAKKMGFRENVYRADLLGMGCSAGLNGLRNVAALACSNTGKLGLLLCVEICSAAYVYNDKISTAVVNSLFGDGAAAALITQSDTNILKQGPVITDFESHTIPESIDAMKFELEDSKLSFYLDRDIPYVIGANVEKPVKRLLGRHSLKYRNIDHWIVHSGGKKVIDAIEYNIGLTDHDLRHTLSVLRDYGNLSSASFLFSCKELMRENIVKEGDIGVVITMGPGTTIETALLVW